MRAAFFVLALASCTHDVAVFDRVDVQSARDLDILFVFDDSPTRATYDTMASQIDILTSQLAQIDGQLPNLHVGVTTTDLGTRGTLDLRAPDAVGNCAGDGNGGGLVTFKSGITGERFLEDLRGDGGTRLRNFASNDLERELGLLTNPDAGTGSAGCETEQPLEAMRRALTPGTNPGFIRQHAMLSIVFLTNEDDCSLARGALLDPNDGTLGPATSFRCISQGIVCDEDVNTSGTKTNCRPRADSPFLVDVAEYQTFLGELKSDPSLVTVSAVAGPTTSFEVRNLGVPSLLPSCSGPGGDAMPAVRLGALVDAFGGSMIDGCTQDAAYAEIATQIVGPQRSCFPNLRRTDGENCAVTEIADGVASDLDRCTDSSTGACWFTYVDADGCPNGDNVGIAIDRKSSTAPIRSRVEATCFAR
jgi:hypothetical protein